MSLKTHIFDISKHLESEEDIAGYLDAVLLEDPDSLPSALGDVARARGMTELAQKTGLSRATLYHTLSEDGNPSYATLQKILQAYGAQFRAVPQGDSTAVAVG